MRRTKNFSNLLIPGLLLLFVLAYLIFFRSPSLQIQLFGLILQPLPVFFLLLFLSLLFIASFLLKNMRRGLLIALFVVGILLLRYFHLRNGLFVLLLGGFFFSLDFLFRPKR